MQYYPESLGGQLMEGELALRGGRKEEKIILEQGLYLSKTDLDAPSQ